MSIFRTPNGDWGVRWRQGTRNRSRVIGAKDDALDFDAEMRRRRRLGGVQVDAGTITLASFSEEWWRRHKPTLAASTQDLYELVLAKHIEPYLGAERLCDITPAVVEEFKLELARRGIGDVMAAKALSVLHGIFAKAVLWGKVSANPVSPVRKPSAARQREINVIPFSDVERLRKRLNSRHRAVVSVLAYAGLRPQEAWALTWADIGAKSINVDKAVSQGEIKQTKTGQRRGVRLLSPLAEDLAEWKQTSQTIAGLVFPYRDGPITDTGLRNWRRKQFKDHMEALDWTKAVPYDLRHGFASGLLREGNDKLWVASQMGHKAATLESTYAHIIDNLGPAEDYSLEAEIRRARGQEQRRTAAI